MQREFGQELTLENCWPRHVIFLIFSKSVSSFVTGLVYPFRALKKLPNGLCLTSGYAFPAEKNCPKDNFLTPKNRKFHEISTFLRSAQEASRKLLGCLEAILKSL